MKISEISRILSEIDAMVSGEVFSEIERDIVLEKLRGLYASVLHMEVEKDIVSDTDAEDNSQPETEVEIVVFDEEEKSSEKLEEDDSAENEEIADIDEVSDPVEESEPESETEETKTTHTDTEKHHAELKSAGSGVQQFLFPDMEPVKKAKKRSVIVANLYGTGPVKETSVSHEESQKKETPVQTLLEAEEQKNTVVEKTEKPVQIIQEKYESEQKQIIATAVPQVEPNLNVAPPVRSLVREISVMDKFVILNELFRGNESEYMKVISDLDAMSSIVDCMIYIDENFVWNPTSRGCRALMDILHRKFEKHN